MGDHEAFGGELEVSYKGLQEQLKRAAVLIVESQDLRERAETIPDTIIGSLLPQRLNTDAGKKIDTATVIREVLDAAVPRKDDKSWDADIQARAGGIVMARQRADLTRK